jgi:hypothetical protein
MSATNQIRAEETVKYKARLKGHLGKIYQGKEMLGRIKHEIQVRSNSLTQWVLAMKLKG